MASSLPDRTEESDLHRRLVERDPVAPAELARLYLIPLIASLRKRNSSAVADEFLQDAAHEALISLIKNPSGFVAARSRARRPLFAYLILVAQRDLQNLMRNEARHWR